ncbi:MAG TPA: Sir2 family NAD-dependent protein deacetylase [Candidatus Limnocylindrales bacterium]
MSVIGSLNLLPHDRLLVLTGAGISVESGLRAFRGADGLWEGQRIEDVATPEGFERDSDRVWAFYSGLRHKAAGVAPNAAHLALAACEERLGDRYLLTTQNIDGLHQLAGSRRVFELHGSLWRTRCSGCGRPPFSDRSEPKQAPPCDRCGALLRPDIVWFGEPVDVEADSRTRQFIKAAGPAHERLVFLAIGTSGAVWPASGFARYAADFGAETWLANLDQADNQGDFAHLATGAATDVVPKLLGI